MNGGNLIFYLEEMCEGGWRGQHINLCDHTPNLTVPTICSWCSRVCCLSSMTLIMLPARGNVSSVHIIYLATKVLVQSRQLNLVEPWVLLYTVVLHFFQKKFPDCSQAINWPCQPLNFKNVCCSHRLQLQGKWSKCWHRFMAREWQFRWKLLL